MYGSSYMYICLYIVLLYTAPQVVSNGFSFTNISCLENFIELNDLCHPRCDRWTTHPSSVVVVQRLAKFIAAITGLLGGFSFMVTAAVRHKHSYVNLLSLLCHRKLCSLLPTDVAFLQYSLYILQWRLLF